MIDTDTIYYVRLVTSLVMLDWSDLTSLLDISHSFIFRITARWMDGQTHKLFSANLVFLIIQLSNMELGGRDLNIL